MFSFFVRASLNFKVASHLILKWKITFIGKILKEFWGHWCLLSCQLKRSYWFLYQSVLTFIATYHNVSPIAPMTSVSFIALSHPPPIKFYFLTTMYFQIINFICSSIVWQSVSSPCCRYHSLSHPPPLPAPLNKSFGSYFLVFGRCGFTPHCGSLTLMLFFGKFTAAECSYVFIYYETFAPVNGEDSSGG